MNLNCIFLLVLPISTNAGISYQVNVGKEGIESNCTITVKGRDMSIVGVEDQELFDIVESQLKHYIKIQYGRLPDDVFVKNPTAYGTFQKHKFNEVRKIIIPKNARIVGYETIPIIVNSQKFVNYSNRKANFTASISQIVKTTTSSSWSSGGEFSAGVSVSYGFKLASLEATLDYAASWGQETGEEEARTVTAKSAVAVTLAPGEGVSAKLTASQGTMKAQVDYNIYVDGQVFAYFDPKFKGRNSRGYHISTLRYNARLPDYLEAKEIISVGLVTDVDVIVEDQK